MIFTIDEVKGKIEKLMRLSSSPNEHEASLALAKAQELMAEYNLGMAECILSDAKVNENQVIVDEFGDDVDDWEIGLASKLSSIFDVRMYINKRIYYKDVNSINRTTSRSILLYGLPMDVETMKSVYQMIQPLIKSIGVKHFAILKRNNVIGLHRGTTMAYKRGWFLGCVLRITERVDEQRRMRLAQDNKMTALVIRKSEIIDEAVKEKMGIDPSTLKEEKNSSAKTSKIGMIQGMRAADSIAINSLIS